MDNSIQQLQQGLAAALRKAETNRRILKICQLICYGGAAIYFIGVFLLNGLLFSGGSSPFMHDYEQNPNPTFWEANKMLMLVIPLFVLITIGSMGLGYFYKKFAAAEQDSVRRIIKKMFSDAKCYLETSEIPASQVTASHFFDGIAKREYFAAHAFGSIVFETNGQKLNVQDIVVRANPGGLAQTQIGGMAVVLKTMLSGLSGKRVENTASAFRGLFANVRLAKAVKGSVVILPDHLERRLDYLAKTIQSMKNVADNKLVQLEDVEFERRFAVYATDEITARYILTPAMMLRMTELQKKYNRDIMLSFNGDMFFFAVAMSEGFLTLGGGSVHSGQAVNDLFDNIEAVRAILKELKLDKAVENEIRL